MIFFDVLQECVIVVIVLVLLLVSLGFLLMDVILIDSFLVQVLDLPDSPLLSLANLGEGFPDDDHVWQGVLVGRVVLVFIESGLRHLVQIVAKHGVIIIDYLSKVCIHDEGLVDLPELRSSG